MATVTNFANAWETTLTADMLGTDLTAQVQTTDGAPASPCYLVIDPHNDDKREYVLFDGTFTTTSFATTDLANRYLDGSAAASGITHAAGAIVRFAPVAQHFRNIQNSAVWLDETQTITGAKTFTQLGGASPTGDFIFDGRAATPIKLNPNREKLWVGNGNDPNLNAGLTEAVQLLVSQRIESPTAKILQHYVGYSFYTGTPGPGTGSLQGGSSESRAFAPASTVISNAVLGHELIGTGDGDTGSSLGDVIGGQGSAWAGGSTTINKLVALRASSPKSISGTPTVTTAIALEVQEPAVGTERFAIGSKGLARLRAPSGDTETLRLENDAGLRRWGITGEDLASYASDGASTRAIFSAGDAPAYRGRLRIANAGTVGLRIDSTVASPTANPFEVVASGGTAQLEVRPDGKIRVGGVRTLYTSGGSLRTDDAFMVRKVASTARPDAGIVGEGGQIFDTDLDKPLWSDGTAWRDATGTAV